MIPKLSVSPWQLALAASIFVVLANNSGFYASLLDLLDVTSLTGFGFLVTITLLMVFVLNAFLITLGVGRALKVIATVTFVVSAGLGYFVNEMGIVFDQEMLVNIADTVREQNTAEARELASRPLMLHLLLFGVIPSVLLVFVRLRTRSPLIEIRNRAAVLMVSAIVVGLLGFGNYRYTTYFAVEHRDLRFQLTPVFPLLSIVKLTREALHDDLKFSVLGNDALQQKVGSRRTVGIMVVGETARSDHFSLNGYEKKTNPVLANENGLLFRDAHSCGTSTAYSVPCMFFLRGRENYTPTVARAESNVLDVLVSAGVETVWIDNNSTCKHVCDRIKNENLRIHDDGSVEHDGDYDVNLVEKTESYLNSDGPDLLIVLHMMGSHGPAYSQRYPADSALFSPYCKKLSPKECSIEEVGNAYDNTIAYTDAILGKLIDALKDRSDEVDSFLFYASDHGESLGENGVYLHGLPYLIAPDSQTDVPLILWLSPEYSSSTGLDVKNVLPDSGHQASHDNIAHTLLGLYGVQTEWYQEDEDILGRTKT